MQHVTKIFNAFLIVIVVVEILSFDLYRAQRESFLAFYSILQKKIHTVSLQKVDTYLCAICHRYCRKFISRAKTKHKTMSLLNSEIFSLLPNFIRSIDILSFKSKL